MCITAKPTSKTLSFATRAKSVISTIISTTAFLALAIITVPVAQADAIASDNWVFIPDSTQTEVHTYINRQSITSNPDNANWRNFEFIVQAAPGAKPQSVPENGSVVLDTTLDCSQGTARINQVRIHTQTYGQGDPAGIMAGSNSFQPQNNAELAQLIISIVCH